MAHDDVTITRRSLLQAGAIGGLMLGGGGLLASCASGSPLSLSNFGFKRFWFA
jgi:hypothetical protein